MGQAALVGEIGSIGSTGGAVYTNVLTCLAGREQPVTLTISGPSQRGATKEGGGGGGERFERRRPPFGIRPHHHHQHTFCFLFQHLAHAWYRLGSALPDTDADWSAPAGESMR